MIVPKKKRYRHLFRERGDIELYVLAKVFESIC